MADDSPSRDLSTGPVGRRLGVGAATQFAGIAAQQVLKFATHWLIARLLGASVLGLFNYSLTFWSAVEMSFTGGLIRTVMRYLPHHVARDEKEHAAGVLWLAAWAAWLGGGVLALIIFLAADPIASSLLDKPEAAQPLRVLAVAMPIAAASGVACATARSLGSIMFIVYQFVFLPLAFVALVPLVRALGGGATGLSWAFAASYMLPLLPLLTYQRRLTRFLPRPEVRPVARAAAGFFGTACLVWLAEYVSRNVDILMVGRLLTTTDTGVYTVAQRISTLPPMVLVAFNAFFSPTVSALYATGRLDELRATFRRASLWIMIVSAPVLGILMSLATPVMAFFGREFSGGALALWILCLGQFVNVGVGLISVVLTMVDRQRTVLACNVAGLVVSAALCLLLIPRYGIIGAAFGTTTLQVVVPATLSLFAHRSVGVSPFSPSYPKPLLAALVAGLATHYLAACLPPVLPQLLVGIPVFVGLYAAGMVALGEKEEALRAIRALREAARRRRQVTTDPLGATLDPPD